MQTAKLELNLDHDLEGTYTLHLALAEALSDIEVQLHEGKQSGTTKVVRDKGTYKAEWELEDTEEAIKV